MLLNKQKNIDIYKKINYFIYVQIYFLKKLKYFNLLFVPLIVSTARSFEYFKFCFFVIYCIYF